MRWMRCVGFGDGCWRAFGRFGRSGEVGVVLKKEEWHCDGGDFIYSSRECVMCERQAAHMKQKGEICCTFHFLYLLDD